MIRYLLIVMVVLALAGCANPHQQAKDGAIDAQQSASRAGELSTAAHADVTVARDRLIAVANDVGKADGHAQRVIVAIDGQKYEVAKSEAETIRLVLGQARMSATEGHAAANRAMSLTEQSRDASLRAVGSAGVVLEQLPNLENVRGFWSQLWDFIRGMGIVIIIVAVVGGLAYLGVGKLIRPLFAMFGVVPRATQALAESMARKVATAQFAGTPPDMETVRTIAEQRGADPVFSKVYSKAYRKEKGKIVDRALTAELEAMP